MGFLDQIGKKATEMYQGAKDKTSQITNELKLKSKISDEKEKISKLYTEIGKLVYDEYSKNTDGFSNDTANKCREITASKESIDCLNKEILALKDTVQCSKCGEPIPKTSDFCSRCGSPVAKEGIVIENKIEQ